MLLEYFLICCLVNAVLVGNLSQWIKAFRARFLYLALVIFAILQLSFIYLDLRLLIFIFHA